MLLILCGGPGCGRVRDQFVPKRFAVVEPGEVYRSGQISPRLIGKTLRDHDIRVVLNLGTDKPGKPAHEAERRAAAAAGATRFEFHMPGDGTGTPEQYSRAVAAIESARRRGEPVLVHCAAGVQRTGGVIAAWRLLVQGKDADEVYAEMRRHGFDPSKNPRLLPHLNAHLSEIARRLVDLDVIARAPEPVPLLPQSQRQRD